MDTIRNLAAAGIMGRTLPAMRFFEPTPRFLRWMKRTYGERLVYDVGAGCGHVAAALADAGLRVLALDLNRREDEKYPLMTADGETYPYEPGSVVMVCRPCHGEFTGAVIRRAAACGASVLYVGLERNLEADLGEHLGRFRRSLSGAGADGECVWKMGEKRG